MFLVCFLGYIGHVSVCEGLRYLVVLVCFLGYIPVLSIGVLERQAVGCAVFIVSQAMSVCVRGYIV